jgi:Fe-S oxidoreductase
VIGLEPSEIYTLRDEFFDLLPHRHAEVKALAQRTFLIDEYLVGSAPGTTGKRILRIVNKGISETRQRGLKILLHGHCYQKSQPPAIDGFPVGQAASAELLRSVGYEVEVIPSGCCGMAGAFGYENEHYDVSMQVGEQVLFPTVRDAGDVVSVAAPGTSCRSQITDGTGVEAKHPLVLVAETLLRV